MLLTKKARAAHLRVGAEGEKAVRRLYLNMGCVFLAQDLRLPGGEIDLIVRDGRTLVFIEVKSRLVRTPEQAVLVHPADALHPEQKRRIYRAALQYMARIGKPSVSYRFDMAETVFLRRKGLYLLKIHQSAFGIREFSYQQKSGPGFASEVPMYF